MRLLFVLFIAMAAGAARLDTAPDDISQLNECIQLRFLDAKEFGMRRILPMQPHGLRTFLPENAAERAIVDRLKDKGYEVSLYLLGRNALAARPPLGTLVPLRSGVQGPAYITPLHGEFPQPDGLIEEGRRALLSFQKGGGYDIRKAGWTVAMRPLRATNQTCIQCHTTGAASAVKVGDPLGVAMYVYRRTRIGD